MFYWSSIGNLTVPVIDNLSTMVRFSVRESEKQYRWGWRYLNCS